MHAKTSEVEFSTSKNITVPIQFTLTISPQKSDVKMEPHHCFLQTPKCHHFTTTLPPFHNNFTNMHPSTGTVEYYHLKCVMKWVLAAKNFTFATICKDTRTSGVKASTGMAMGRSGSCSGLSKPGSTGISFTSNFALPFNGLVSGVAKSAHGGNGSGQVYSDLLLLHLFSL